MIATARHQAAPLPELWAQAAEIRQEWLEIGLSVTPADRAATEEAIASLYPGDRPSFIWVPSPEAALPHLDGLPTHRTLQSWVADRRPPGRPPVASDIAAGLSRLRSAIMASFTEPPPDRKPMQRPKGKPWPTLRPADALDGGLPFQELVRQGVGEALGRTLSGVRRPIRSAVGDLPVGWYGHQDAAWIGQIEVLRRLGLVSAGPAWSTWPTLARSAGWWWPGERRCVVVERPVALRTEPIPGAWYGERRLVSADYSDGFSVIQK